ncbi:MAG: sensor histidine kinase [Rhizomicrobium sp.]
MDSSLARASHCARLAHAAMDPLSPPERDMVQQLRQKDILLREMQHRVANSLQIVASILLMKARMVQSEEARRHLRDAHGRVLSIAAIQKRLQVSESGEQVDVGPYLADLCESLDATLIDGMRPISLRASAERGAICAEHAASIGLIVTELVINALKHAFATDDEDCRIEVLYEAGAAGWRLSVRDNGGGASSAGGQKQITGLGTSIVESLARQMDATVQVKTGAQGYSVTITQRGFG